MPKNNYKVSDEGIELLVEFEGEILKVYKDPIGLPTLGVGHLVTKDEKKDWPVGKKITKAQSRAFLRQDLARFESAVNNTVTVPITQNQFDALVSLAFNIGESAFKRSSVLRNLNNRKFQAAADSFLAWNKAGGKTLHGLTRRRNTERSVFLTPDPKASAATQPQTSTEEPAGNPTAAGFTASPQAPQEKPPPIEQPKDAVPVQIVTTTPAPSEVPPQETAMTKIGNQANAAYTAFGTIAAGVIAWFANMGPIIIVSVMGTVTILGLSYIVTNWRRSENKENRDLDERKARDERELNAKLDRERREHEVQMALITHAANKDANTVVLTPPAVVLPNGDAPAEGEMQV